MGLATPNPNLDDEARQHLLDAPRCFDSGRRKLHGSEIGPQDEVQLKLELPRGPERDIEEAAQIPLRGATAPLGDVGSNRHTGASDLAGQVKALVCWKRLRNGVYL